MTKSKCLKREKPLTIKKETKKIMSELDAIA